MLEKDLRELKDVKGFHRMLNLIHLIKPNRHFLMPLKDCQKASKSISAFKDFLIKYLIIKF